MHFAILYDPFDQFLGSLLQLLSEIRRHFPVELREPIPEQALHGQLTSHPEQIGVFVSGVLTQCPSHGMASQ